MFSRSTHGGTICCPCYGCANLYWCDRQTITDHLVEKGFLPGYTHWIFHGEPVVGESSSLPESSTSANPNIAHPTDAMDDLLRASTGHFLNTDTDANDDDAATYYKLAYEAALDLYPGCKNFSKLQFIIRLLNIKNLYGAVNEMFDEILQLLAEALPEGNQVPRTIMSTTSL